MNTMNNAAKYLPITTSNSFTGEVSKSSKVPNFCSSANNLIVKPGAIKIRKNTAPARNPLIDASANAFDTDATKKKPVTATNAAATTYAIGDAK